MRTKTLLSTAALALVISAGAVAQSVRNGEPLQNHSTSTDSKSRPPAEHNGGGQPAQNSTQGNPQQGSNEAGKNVRTVYPNQTGPQQPQQSSQNQPAQRPNQNAPAPQQSAQQPAPQQNAQQPSSQPSGTAQSTPPAPSTQQPPATTAQQSQPQQSTAQPRGQQSAEQNGAGKSGVVALNTQAQTRIGATISHHNVKPLTNVSFSISIGTAVPRSVQLRALPTDVVSFVPQYRGFSYFVVEEQIVIVDPASHEIAAIVPYAGATSRTATTSVRREAPARHTAAAPTNSKPVKLDTEQREIIRRHVTHEHSASRTSRTSATPAPRQHYNPGDRVSRSVTIETLPETVYREVPPVRRYRYFNEDNDVILVDPDDDRVVDVIR